MFIVSALEMRRYYKLLDQEPQFVFQRKFNNVDLCHGRFYLQQDTEEA